MFRGSSSHTIDSKGRLIIPARFRNIINAGNNDTLIITRLDSSLSAYTHKEWERIEAKILSLAEKNANMRRFRSFFVGGASECPCDKHGRVLIPPLLREFAKLQKETVLVGVLDHFEIWSREIWDKENMQMEKDMTKEELRNEIAKLGL